MQTLTPVPPLPAETLPAALAALARLAALRTHQLARLDALPAADDALLDALRAPDTALHTQALSQLLQRIDQYWDSPDTVHATRHDAFVADMRQALHDELSLKIHEDDLDVHYAGCLPTAPGSSPQSPDAAPGFFSLYIQVQEDERIEMLAALAMSGPQGHTLLVLPGVGATGFTSQNQMCQAVAGWLNDPTLKGAVLNTVEKRHQDLLASIDQDPDADLEPFTRAHLQLDAIDGDPYAHAMSRLRHKQREDVRHACLQASLDDQHKNHARIQQAIAMRGLWGPAAMLELRELNYQEREYRKNLPDWIKTASQQDLRTYAMQVQHYHQAHTAMLSVLGAAMSPQNFALEHLRTRLCNDLGEALDPAAITVGTRRTLALTGETYTVTRTLVELALYGLHPDDRLAGSAFLEHSTLMLSGAPLPARYASLTPHYLAGLIEELDLRLAFRAFQRTQHQQQAYQPLMHLMTRRQVIALAFAAQMQGHIQPQDFALVEALARPTADAPDANLRIQQIRLGGHLMSKLLLFSQYTPAGQPDRLVMVMTDAPTPQRFKTFSNETQLLHELVSYARSEKMSQYLLDQLPVDARTDLAGQLAALKLKPHPRQDLVELIEQPDFDVCLRSLTEAHVRVALSEEARYTPEWYRRASPAQRQQLLALEDDAAGALRNYQAKAHTNLQPLRHYAHERASQRISTLLNVPPGSVDPDLIIITSARETLSYTDMLLKGYDDSIDFFNTSTRAEALFKGPPGVDLSVLTPAAVAHSVRGQWLADDYIAKVQGSLLAPESQGYEYRRTTSLLITRLQMKSAALRSLLKGHINEVQYQWLEQSIEQAHLGDAETRRRYPLYPLQIHLDQPFIGSGLKGIDQLVIPDVNLIHVETVQGCIAVLPTSVRQAALLYTPQAPDGIEWRLFGSFTESLGAPGMIDYYTDRCSSKTRHTLSLHLKSMQQGNASKPPFLPREPIADFADTCFNRPILRKLREVQDTTTGRNDMLAKLIWNSVELIATIVTLPFPPASFAVGTLLYLHDTVRAFQSLRDGDTPAAMGYLLTGMLNGLGAAGDLHSGLKGFGGVMRRLARQNPPDSVLPPLTQRTSLPRYEELFPASLHNEPFVLGKADINGHHPVLLAPGPTSPDVQATGQFARRAADGTWQPLGLPYRQAGTAGLYNGRPATVSLHGVPRISEGHGRGVCLLDGNHYIEFSGQTWQVQYSAYLKSWQIIDPQNPFAFFGKHPVRLNEQGTWQLADRQILRGGAPDNPPPYKPLQEDTTTQVPLDNYQLPAKMRLHLDVILNKEPYDPIGLGLHDYFEVHFSELRQTFANRREQLYKDANAFFLSQPPLPPKPVLPPLQRPATLETLFGHVFTHSNGLVLGEAPQSIASKRLLILNMPLLVEQRVEVLYVEHVLLDKHLPKLNRYRHLGKKSRTGSHEIKHYLDEVNHAALNNGSTEFDYYHLIKTAHRYGIEVRPLNSSISYPFIEHPVTAMVDDADAGRKMSNYFAHLLIDSDLAEHSSRRWVALLDDKQASTHAQLPGLAELQGVPSARIQDIAFTRRTSITTQTSPSTVAGPASGFDVIIDFANPYIIAPPSPPSTALDLALFKRMASNEGVDIKECWAGDYGFRWHEPHGWLQTGTEHWTPAPPLTALQQSLAQTTYEVAREDRSLLHWLANFEHKGLDRGYLIRAPELSRVRTAFFEVRRSLEADSRAILSHVQPPRPKLPAVSPQTSLPTFLETLYQHTQAVVIGESHASIASKKLIIDNLPLLSQHQVRTLYMEHLLTDLHQADLDRFFDTGQMSKTLLHDLKKLDAGHHTDPSGVYTFEQLVIMARQYGLQVRAIDCTASYHLKGLDGVVTNTRQQMMNYFALQTIDRHQQVIGAHRWIALVGNSHVNTYRGIVPGLAELKGGIGLHVVDTLPGQAKGVFPDPGEALRLGMTNDTVYVKADYRVEIEVSRPARSAPTAEPLEIRLNRPGQFLVEHGDGHQHTLVHRSRDGQIHRTPVQVNDQNKLYVDRPSWTSVHLVPHEDINALVQALERLNLTRVNAGHATLPADG